MAGTSDAGREEGGMSSVGTVLLYMLLQKVCEPPLGLSQWSFGVQNI